MWGSEIIKCALKMGCVHVIDHMMYVIDHVMYMIDHVMYVIDHVMYCDVCG